VANPVVVTIAATAKLSSVRVLVYRTLVQYTTVPVFTYSLIYLRREGAAAERQLLFDRVFVHRHTALGCNMDSIHRLILTGDGVTIRPVTLVAR
jgi:hypothetical protein